MTPLPDHQLFEQLVQRIDPAYKLVRTWALTGGVSAQVTALEVVQADGTPRQMVVRQHGVTDLQRYPHIAAAEFKLLALVHRAGIAAPQPLYVEETGEIFGTPVLVTEFIDGQTLSAPTNVPDFIAQFATQLSRIHLVEFVADDVAFLPQQAKRVTAILKNPPLILDDTLNEKSIRQALDAVWPLDQRNPAALLHGDYWPGNSLWRAGQLAAIIDWEDAGIGDPLADLGNARLEILWAGGEAAMHQFTRHYQRLMPLDYDHLPYWDLVAALRPASTLSTWGLDAPTEERMREAHHQFVAQALKKIVTP